MMANNWKNKDFNTALKNSFSGIVYAFKNERNLKIQFCIAILVIFIATILHINLIKFAILLTCIALVIFAEMINTTIERVLDLYSTNYNEKIKIAKDIASGAVLINSIFACIIGVIIILPELIKLLKIF